MLTAAGQAFQELFTPPFRAVLIKCAGFTIGLLVVLIVGIEWTFSHFVQWPGWIEKTIEWLGGLALVVGSIFLIPPVTSLIASLYLDDIAGEVSQHHGHIDRKRAERALRGEMIDHRPSERATLAAGGVALPE